jgi:endonuclease III
MRMPVESKAKRLQRTAEIIAALKRQYPAAKCSLDHGDPLQLLVATILSAQCTDERVNIVTKDLFGKYPDVRAYASAGLEELQQDIRTTGFFRNKAKSIVGSAQKIIADFGGQVPRTMEQLLTLPGVARKTANVVLGNAFGIADGIVVDTHVSRLAGRLKLTAARKGQPEKIERDLMELVPKEDWTLFAHLLIFHGRATCTARKPDCAGCVIQKLCPSAFKV